jgi:Ca2+-binding RTX toxin-like protein
VLNADTNIAGVISSLQTQLNTTFGSDYGHASADISGSSLIIRSGTPGVAIGTITAVSGAGATITTNIAHTTSNIGSNTILDLSGTDSLTVLSGSSVNATVTANYTAASAANAGTINITTAGFVVNMGAETGSTGSISITNTGSATTLVGGAGSNTINGGVGNDTINGGAGSATINGGEGNDMITAGAAGTNNITGGYGDDTIVGSASVDTINVDYGTDTITNLGTGDVLTVNYYATANATLSGTSPSWTPTSSTTNNGVLNLATAASVDLHLITTNTGTISINASTASGATTLKGAGAGITNIIGGAGADAITANGAGSIVGGAGADTLSVATTGALSVSDSDGITITVSGSTASNITTTSALTETTITGDTGVDTITLAGSVSNVATITGGQGADVINLGTSHTGGVKLVFSAYATNGIDQISSFITGTDKVSFGGVDTSIATSGTAISGTAAARSAHTNHAVEVIGTALTGAAANLTTSGTHTLATADLTAVTLTNVAAYIAERLTVASGDNGVFILNTTAALSGITGGAAYVYEFHNGADTTLGAADLTLIGVISGGIVASGDVA